MNNPTIKPQVVPIPFHNFCMSIGAIPTSYKDSLDYYETLLWLIKFLDETVMPALDTNGEAVAELQNLYIELKNYVEHYFDNLDVQEEINNKLDKMVEDGTLEEIIAQYITNNIQRTYKTNNDLINDIGLTTGMMVKTLGETSVNDGRGCYYLISDNAPEPLPSNINNEELDNFYLTTSNGLYAIPTNNINDDYYNEITVTREYINNTTCYFTNIPYLDNNNDEIKAYVKYNGGLDISDYAREHKTTISMNCTLGVINPDTTLSENAVVISDGEIINNNMNPPSFLNDYYKYVGIKDNRVFTDYQANITTGEQMIADGVKQAFLCFGKMVNNGIITNYTLDAEDDIMATPYPRQIIGIKLDKTIIVLTCDGRNSYDKGLTGPEAAQIMIEKGCVNVWNLDGGGSANTVFKGSRINKYVTNTHLGINERHIAYTLNFKKPTTNKNIDDNLSKVGIEKANLYKMLIPLIPQSVYKNPLDCDEYTTGINILTGYNSTNTPNDEANGYLITIPIASNQNLSYGKYCKQLWLSRDNNNLYVRTYTNETFTRWQRLNTLFNAEISPASNQTLGINASYTTIALNSVSDYMPSTLSINENNEIITDVSGGIQVMAYFNLDISLDSDVTIRLMKNDSIAKAVTISCKAGEKYQIFLTKQLSLSTSDKIYFRCNSNNNTGGLNKLSSGNIEILQNI